MLRALIAGFVAFISLAVGAAATELVAQSGHTRSVYAVSVSPDGSLVASAGFGKVIKLWHSDSGELLRELVGHEGAITSLGFWEGSKTLVSGSQDGTLRFWEVSTGRLLDLLVSGAGPVNDVAFDPRQRLLASAHAHGVVQIWDADRRVPIANMRDSRAASLFPSLYLIEPTGATSVAFDPVGERLATGHRDKGVVIWDLRDGQVLAFFDVGDPEALAFSPEGETLAVGTSEGQIRFYAPSRPAPLRVLAAHTGAVRSLTYVDAVMRKGEAKMEGWQRGTLVSAGHDGAIRWWREGALEMEICASSQIYDAAIDPRGRFVVTAAGSFEVVQWSVDAGRVDRGLGAPHLSVNDLAYSPDGRSIALATSSSVIPVVDVETGRVEKWLSGHEERVFQVAFSPDGSLLASSSMDKSVRLWSWPSGEILSVLEGDTGNLYLELEFSPDSATLAAAATTELVLLDVPEGRRQRGLESFGLASDVTYSRDGSLLAAAFSNLKWGYGIWNLQTRRLVQRLDPPYTYQGGEAVGIPLAATSLFSADGKRLIGGFSNGLINVWDLAEGRTLATVEHASSADRGTELPDAAVGQGTSRATLALSPDGRLLASSGIGPEIRLWDSRNLELVQILERPGAGGGGSLAFAPDGRSLAMGDWSGRLQMWRVGDGELLSTMYILPGQEFLTTTPQGHAVASEGAHRFFRRRLGNRLTPLEPEDAAGWDEAAVERRLAERSAVSASLVEDNRSVPDPEALALIRQLDEESDQTASKGRFLEAVEKAQQAFDEKKRLYGPNHRELAFAHFRLGSLLLRLGQYGRAEAHLTQALEIWSGRGGELSQKAVFLSALGKVYRVLGQPERGHRYQIRALDVALQSVGDLEILLRIYIELALDKKALGRPERARDELAQLHSRLKRSFADKPEIELLLSELVAEIVEPLAQIHLSLGEDAEAKKLFLRSLELRAGTPPQPDARMLERLTEQFVSPLEPTDEEWLEAQERALEAQTAAQLRSTPLVIFTDRSSSLAPRPGDASDPNYQLKRTFERVSEAMAAREEWERQNEAEARDEDESDADFFARLEIKPLISPLPLLEAKSHWGLGQIALKRNRLDEAERRFHKALELTREGIGPRHPEIAHLRSDLAYVRSEKEKTPQAFDQAVETLLQGVDFETGFLEALFLQSTENEKFALLEADERDAMLLDRLLSLLSRLPASSPRIAEGYRAVQDRKLLAMRARSRQLELLASGVESAKRDEYVRLSQELSVLEHGTPPTVYAKGVQAALRQQLERVEDEMARASPAFDLDRRIERAGAAEILQALPEGAALIDLVEHRAVLPGYGATGERYLAFVLTADSGVVARDLGSTKSIDGLVQRYRSAMSRFDPRRLSRRERERSAKELSQLGRSLYGQLLEPLIDDDLLPASGTIFVAPDGLLHLLPFEALVDEDQRYLIDRFQLRYLGRGLDLLRFSDVRRRRGAFVVFAAPDYGAEGGRFEPLEEPAALTQALRGAGIPAHRVLIGPAATEASLYALERPRWLHIATHGFFAPSEAHRDDAVDPLLRSGLAFAGANQVRLDLRSGDREDGIATALEISTALDLTSTELVVLSACETGVGEVRPGEGVFGLARAFQTAGAQSVVMSLWRVADSSTARLMADFYRELEKGQSKGEALRAAARALKLDPFYAHPYFWAPFIFTGNPD